MFTKHYLRNILCLLSSLVICSAKSPALAAPAPVANAAYAQAQRALGGRNYAESTRLFYQLVTQADGDMKFKSEFGLAESLKQMGFFHSAAYFYMRIASRGSQNPFFRNALVQLADINSVTSLGRANVSSLFNGKTNIDPISVPPEARGFYFFYKGLEFYDKEKAAESRAEFARVPRESPYYSRAQYYVGILSAISKDPDMAIRAFNAAVSSTNKDSFRNLSLLALARIYYEQKQIRRAFEYYSQIPRDSDLWLESVFEGSWAFFLIQKHNNTLGNIHTIHSPFFDNRFFPETYILEAITYLKLCYFPKVDESLIKFQARYKPTLQDLNNLLKKYNQQYNSFFNLNLQYHNTRDLREFPATKEIIDSTSRSDAFKEAIAVVRTIDREDKVIARSYAAKWENTGLMDVLRRSFEERKAVTITRAGQDLFSQTIQAFKYLKDLSEQVQLIVYERRTAQTDELRSKFNAQDLQIDNNMWGEGMKPLNLSTELEYWPFEGEYWEDELGSYVYNIESKCGKSAKGPSAIKNK